MSTRIVLFGDGAWARGTLQALQDEPGFELCGVVLRHASPDEALRDLAQGFGVRVYAPEKVNARAFVDEVRTLAPDVIVSVSYDQIFRAGMCEAARMATINCHAGALPFYRGRNVLNWALINGETSFGVTVHLVDPSRIDTGDILRQDTVPITPEDDYASVLEKAHRKCPETVMAALRELVAGTAQTVPQESVHPVGFYCGGREEGDEWLDWSWPSRRIHDFVRAITHPAPGARTLLGEREIVVWKSELVPGAVDFLGTPGQVIGRDGAGITVKTGDNQLRVTSVSEVDSHGRPLEREIPRYRIGTRLGVNLHAECLRLRRELNALRSHATRNHDRE